jgi:hypothetical protein
LKRAHQILTELWKERRLDTNRVFLYNDRPIQRIGMAKAPVAEQESPPAYPRFPPFRQYEYETGRGRHGDGDENRWSQVGSDAPAL